MTEFQELSRKEAVRELTGEVTCRWKLREIRGNPAFVDNGPLEEAHGHVFNLLLMDEQKNKIMVHFYDAWAVGAQNVTNGDHLIITCPARAIFPSNRESGDNIPFCLAIWNVDGAIDHIEIRVRRKPSMEFLLTSHNITTTCIPEPAPAVKLKRQAYNKLEEASKKAKHANTVYSYISWDDVHKYDNVEANLYAMIYDYKYMKISPNATHRYSISFGIVGLTPAPTAIIPLVIFSKNELKVPRPVSVGDIIRIHRAKIQKYQDAPQVVAWVDKSSFMIFHRKCNIHTGLPLSTWHRDVDLEGTALRNWHVASSADDYSWTASDQEILDSTYAASQKYLLNAPNDTKDHIFSSLYDIEHHINTTNHDIVTWETVVMVVNVILPEAGIAQPDKDDHLCMWLLVWDGTNAGEIVLDESSSIVNKHTFYHVYSAIRCGVSYARQDLRETQVDVAETMANVLIAEKIVDPLSPNVPLNIKFATSQPNVKILGGLSFVKVASSAKQRLVIRDLRLVPGQWIRLKQLVPDNSEFRIPHGMRYTAAAKFNDSSIINALPTYHRDVIAVLRAFHNRLLMIPRPTPPRQLVSSCGIPFSTLAMCLATPAPAVFVTLVKIVAWHPTTIASFVYSDTSNAHTTKTFMFSLRVQDDSSFADIIEGEKLLGGISADKFSSTVDIQSSVDSLMKTHIEEETLVELKVCTYMTSRGVGQSADDEDHRPLLKRLAVFDSCLLKHS